MAHSDVTLEPMQAAALKTRSTPFTDQRIRLRVDWNTYKALLAARGDAPSPRVAYFNGVMELMAPARTHETIAGLIGRLLEVWSEENDVLIERTKSWTLEDESDEAGAEPDESWVLGERPDAARPDLALEVVHKHGGLDKLNIYARLGVREVWFWVDGKLSVHVLRGRRYAQATRSHLFKTLDVELLARFARHASPARAPRLYRAALKRH